MKNNLISEFYKSYSHKFEPHRVDIIDNYLDGELTILDDTVGGFVYLNENNLPIDILNLNLIICRL